MTTKTVGKVLSIAIAASIGFGFTADTGFAAQKKRKTLMEALFPKATLRAKQRRAREQQRLSGKRVVVPAKKKPKIKKVKGPTYYNYTPEKFRNVSVKSILTAIAAVEVARAQEAAKANEVIDIIEIDYSKEQMLDNTSTGAIDNKLVLSQEGLQELKISSEKKIASAIEKHYSKDPSHLWLDGDYKLTSDAKLVIDAFEKSDAYGLDASHYEVQSIDNKINQGKSPAKAAAEFEIEMTINVLRYMADANDGAINPNKISGYHDFGSYKREYDTHLEKLLAADNPASAMFLSHPQNPQFKALRNELAALKTQEDAIVLEPIKSGTFIRPGQENAELPKIIKAIAAKGSKELTTQYADLLENEIQPSKYDDEIVELVKAFQAERKLKPDGIIGKNTLSKLVDVSPKKKIMRVKLAMERLRWLPEKLGRQHVFINQPAYNASYMINNKPHLSMRAIVGKLSNQTNFFYDTIETVEVNPYWNVPRSILVNEKLSKLQANPYYYQKRGFEILKHGGKVVDPGTVNWYDEKSTKKYYIRQKPGGSNALGDVKILFPNKHSIYMHDTPSRGLFKRSNRALSHGCVRLHKPREMAAAVMGTNLGKMNNLISEGKNRAMRVPSKMPVYVSYFTAWPNSKGTVSYYSDIYGRDKALEKALSKTSKVRVSALNS